jgi:hypothetical protein
MVVGDNTGVVEKTGIVVDSSKAVVDISEVEDPAKQVSDSDAGWGPFLKHQISGSPSWDRTRLTGQDLITKHPSLALATLV